MNAAQAIAPKKLFEASQQLARCDGFGSRLTWWLQHAHSSERWVQFEWAYQLQQLVVPDFAVLCEHHRRDVSLIPAHQQGAAALFKADSVADIELKWWGNWWADPETVARLTLEDLNKVDGYGVPAAAVLLLLMVGPSAPGGAHAWIQEQTKKLGVQSVDEFRSRLPPRAERFEDAVEVQCGPTFSSASLHTLVFPNKQLLEQLKF